jgi:hypothetical protein
MDVGKLVKSYGRKEGNLPNRGHAKGQYFKEKQMDEIVQSLKEQTKAVEEMLEQAKQNQQTLEEGVEGLKKEVSYYTGQLKVLNGLINYIGVKDESKTEGEGNNDGGVEEKQPQVGGGAIPNSDETHEERQPAGEGDNDASSGGTPQTGEER